MGLGLRASSDSSDSSDSQAGKSPIEAPYRDFSENRQNYQNYQKPPPADALSSHHSAPFSPVESLSGLDGDAQALATVLKLYRGWAGPDELARKSGLGSQERVLMAATELVNAGLATIENGQIKPTGRLTVALLNS